VTAVVFDCPCWDCDLTDRFRLPVAAKLLEAAGKREAALACRRIADKPDRITVDDQPWVAMQALDAQYLDLFFHGRGSTQAYEALMSSAGFSDEQWARGQVHAPLLAAMYEPQLHLMARLAVPSLLVHGEDDLVVPPHIVDLYTSQVPTGAVHTFPESGPLRLPRGTRLICRRHPPIRHSPRPLTPPAIQLSSADPVTAVRSADALGNWNLMSADVPPGTTLLSIR